MLAHFLLSTSLLINFNDSLGFTESTLLEGSGETKSKEFVHDSNFFAS